LASIEQARTSRLLTEDEEVPAKICVRIFDIGCVVEDLGMAVRLNKYSEQNVRLMLKPWIGAM
jgi:hypothetical protein